MNPRIYSPEYYRVLADVEHRDPWALAMREVGLGLIEGRLRPGGAILDLGCGAGLFLEEAVRRFKPSLAVGADVSSYAESDVRCSAVELPFADGSFDLGVLNDVLQHLSEPEAAVGEFRRVLRPGGLLLIRTAARRGLPWKAHVDSDDYRQWNRDSLRNLLDQAGFRVERLTPVNCLPSLVADVRMLAAPRPRGDVGLRVATAQPAWKRAWLERYWRWERRRVVDQGRSLPAGHFLIALATV